MCFGSHHSRYLIATLFSPVYNEYLPFQWIRLLAIAQQALCLRCNVFISLVGTKNNTIKQSAKSGHWLLKGKMGSMNCLFFPIMSVKIDCFEMVCVFLRFLYKEMHYIQYVYYWTVCLKCSSLLTHCYVSLCWALTKFITYQLIVNTCCSDMMQGKLSYQQSGIDLTYYW